ncbi:amidohydrolase [Ruminococcaceae bacterium OttesenSCG-928-I18]|nr:amidohydrolase [Ruminococcaceae bacterium OttesenSCG-928-I18]
MTTWIKGGEVLQLTPQCHLEKQDILVEDGSIAAVGEVPAQTKADQTMDARGKLIMPGLVNCHTHSYMTLFRNYADDLSFQQWLFEKIMPVEDRLGGEDAYWGNMLASIEMIRTGTTTFSDMHMFKHQCVQSCADTGLRAVLARGLACGQEDAEGGKRRLDEAFEEMEEAKKGGALVSFMLGPHAIYTCHKGYLQELEALAREKQLRFHIHVSETKHEVDSCKEEHGVSPVQYLAGLGIFDRPTVAAHCVWVDEEDIDILREKNVNVVTNPVSNMKLGNGFAPFTKMHKAGINLCIGTDGAASNNSLNLFREMSTLSYIHKGVDLEAQSTPADLMLRCATLNGAKALGLADKIGSLEAGKRADLLLIDLDRPQFQPQNDLVTGLIYAANGSEVDTVLVDGRVLMEKGELKTIDEEQVYFEMEKRRQKYLV